MSLVPSPWPIVHISRQTSTDPDDEDDHGNYPPVVSAPVVRRAMSIMQHGRNGSSHQVMSAESLDRTETTIALTVADTTIYKSQDQVLIFPELDVDGNYVSGTGIAYFVDGLPTDERVGPWPSLLKMFGGNVRLRRVT